jgi:hypothetical protein
MGGAIVKRGSIQTLKVEEERRLFTNFPLILQENNPTRDSRDNECFDDS